MQSPLCEKNAWADKCFGLHFEVQNWSLRLDLWKR